MSEAVTIVEEAFRDYALGQATFTTYQGSIQSSAFKTPQAENPKRRAQFGFRFDF